MRQRAHSFNSVLARYVRLNSDAVSAGSGYTYDRRSARPKRSVFLGKWCVSGVLGAGVTSFGDAS